QAIWIGMKSLFDDLIRYMRAVVVTCVDMVHTSRHRLSQNSNRGVPVTGWSPNVWTRQLHRAIAHAVHRKRSSRKREAAAQIVRVRHFFSFSSVINKFP